MGEMISIPIEEYRQLREAREELEDLRAYDAGMAALAAGTEEQIPSDVAKRLIAGESPVRVWREYRGLSKSALARASVVDRVQIIQIEAGQRAGSAVTLKKLAAALGIALDDLV